MLLVKYSGHPCGSIFPPTVYRLNIDAPTNSYVEALINNVTVFGGGTFGR